MSITPEFIREEIAKQTYEISLHADDERIADGLTVSQVEVALSGCKVIEDYPDDPRGESCLTVGFTADGKRIQVVCGRNTLGHLVLVTVYIPTMPKWKDPYTRNA
jgi:hypothetical protein